MKVIMFHHQDNLDSFENLKETFSKTTMWLYQHEEIFGPNIFDHEAVLRAFMYQWDVYKGYYYTVWGIKVDQVAEIATRCVESIIKMNSWAGAFHVLQ